jgi:hypothetical protein
MRWTVSTTLSKLISWSIRGHFFIHDHGSWPSIIRQLMIVYCSHIDLLTLYCVHDFRIFTDRILSGAWEVNYRQRPTEFRFRCRKLVYVHHFRRFLFSTENILVIFRFSAKKLELFGAWRKRNYISDSGYRVDIICSCYAQKLLGFPRFKCLGPNPITVAYRFQWVLTQLLITYQRKSTPTDNRPMYSSQNSVCVLHAF